MKTPAKQRAWERAMGFRGYRCSPAEREDRRLGIKPSDRECRSCDALCSHAELNLDDICPTCIGKGFFK